MTKKLLFIAALIALAAIGFSQPTSATYNRVTIKDSIRFRGVWYKVWPTGGGGGPVIDTSFDSNFWRKRGNVAASGGLDFLGTLNGQPLNFRVANVPAMTLENTGTSLSTLNIGKITGGASLTLGNILSPPDLTNNIIARVDLSIKSETGGIQIRPNTTLRLLNITTTDTTTAKPLGITSIGTVFKMANWGSAIGVPTIGNYWQTGGNSAPGTTNFTLGSNTTDDVTFVTAGSPVMTLQKSGGVGVRTASPNSSLDVGGSFGARLIYRDMEADDVYTIEPNVADPSGALTYVVDFTGEVFSNATINLPPAINAKDRIIIIKRTPTNSGGTLNLAVTGGGSLEATNGSQVSSVAITPNSTYWYQSDGNIWYNIFVK